MQDLCPSKPMLASETQPLQSKPGELSTARSWVYLGTFGCTSFLTWGIIMSFPVLFVAILGTFKEDRFETSTVGSIQIGLLYMLAIIPGYLVPIYGLRIIVIIGFLLMAAGFISSMFVNNLYFLYITMGLGTSLGASFCMTANDSAPLMIFYKRRSFVNCVSHLCGAAGMAVMPIATHLLLETYGIRGALLLLAGILLQGVVFGMLYPRSQKKSIEELKGNQKTATNRYLQVIKTPIFWCLAAGDQVISALSNGCRIFLIDRAITNGIPKSQAVLALSLWGVFSGVSALLSQLPIIDKTPKRRQLVLILSGFSWCLVTASSVLFNSYTGLVSYCILAGTFHGFNVLLWYLVLADLMEGELFVTAFSLLCFIAGPSVIFGVPIAGFIYDQTKNYDVPYLIYSAVGVLGSICVSFIACVSKRKGEDGATNSIQNTQR